MRESLARTAAFVGLLVTALVAAADAPRLNGFALEPSDVPAGEILRGGPPRDGIPALDEPRHAGADESWPDDAWVLGVEVDGEARAYPIAVLVWHELVNDRLGGRPILVSWCPLCGTGMVFDRRLADGAARRFGVSGLLYRSDVLMYDRESESLWSQISAKALTGPARGQRLTLLRSSLVPWGEWRARHPATSVLSRDTGHRRDYGRSPYGDYPENDRLLFPVEFERRFPPKTRTLGLRLREGPARAYPAPVLVMAGGEIAEDFAGHPVRVRWDAESRVFSVDAPEAIEVVEGYWFAWAAFHPEASVAGDD